MILHKKPRKAQFGVALASGALKAGIGALTQLAQTPGVELGYDAYEQPDIEGTAFNNNMMQQFLGNIEDAMPSKLNPIKSRKTQAAYDALQDEFVSGGATDQYGNIMLDKDKFMDLQTQLSKNKNKKVFANAANKTGYYDDGEFKTYEADAEKAWNNYMKQYNQQYMTSFSNDVRNQDMQAAQAMYQYSNGGKLVPKECRGGKVKGCGGKVKGNGGTITKVEPGKVSKLKVDKKGNKMAAKKTVRSKYAPVKTAKTLSMKSGGKLEEPGKVNVVVKGKLHKENNNLGKRDKGVPVITPDGTKTYEVEKQEIIFRKALTEAVEKVRDKHKNDPDDELLEKLGKIVAEELLHNTQDNDGKFGVEVKDEKKEEEAAA